MRDPYLEAMLHGEFPKKRKDSFEIALDKSIQEYLDTLTFEPGGMLSPQAKRDKLEKDLKESITHSELRHYLAAAVQILRKDGRQYLDKQAYSTMLAALKFDQILHLSSETIHQLFNIAVAKFKEERYDESLSLFVLLTVLQPKEFDLWYRLGIAAWTCENDSLALNAYAVAKDLNPNLIEAYLFSVECYLKLGMKQEAASELAIAEKLIEIEPSKSQLLEHTRKLLQ